MAISSKFTADPQLELSLLSFHFRADWGGFLRLLLLLLTNCRICNNLDLAWLGRAIQSSEASLLDVILAVHLARLDRGHEFNVGGLGYFLLIYFELFEVFQEVHLLQPLLEHMLQRWQANTSKFASALLMQVSLEKTFPVLVWRIFAVRNRWLAKEAMNLVVAS